MNDNPRLDALVRTIAFVIALGLILKLLMER